MIDLSKYFTEDKEKYKDQGIVIYQFNDSKREDFIKEMLVPIREALVSERKIRKDMEEYHMTRKESIKSHIPTTSGMKPASFGEALTYYLVKILFNPIPNVCPMKLSYWSLADTPMPGSDVLCFFVPDYTLGSPDDIMYSVEVKTWGDNPYHTKSAINNAIEGAITDQTSRAAESIDKLLILMRDSGETLEMYKQVNRFGEENYDKNQCKTSNNTLAIVNSEYLDRHIENILPETIEKWTKEHSDIHVYCLPIVQLQKLYERFYAEMINT